MSAQPTEHRIRKFYFYRLTDGVICGSVGAKDHEGFEARVRSDAAASDQGAIEYDGDLELLQDRVDISTGKLIDPVDHEFHANLEREWQWILQAHPMLANPVAPSRPPKSPGGQQSFSSTTFWEDFAARAASGAWHLRCPTDKVEGLAGPFHAIGGCLTPVFAEGHIDYYDPNIPAQDEDIVLVKLDALERQRFQERNRDDAAWMATYGTRPSPLCTKLLKAFAGEWWLVTNRSMFRLGKNTILGVLRHTTHGGESKYGVPSIQPDATSDPPVVSAPADGNIVYTAGTQPRIEAAGLNASTTYANSSGGTLKAVVGWSGQATINNLTSGVAVGEARLGIKVVINSVTVDDRWISLETHTADYALFSGEAAYEVPNGQSITVNLAVARAFSTSGASPAQTITWRAANLSLTPLKR